MREMPPLTTLGEVARVPREEPCAACRALVVITGPRGGGLNQWGIFCGACRRQRCRECGRRGGRHHPACQWDRRQRYVPSVKRNLVPPEDLVRLYVAYRFDLLRRAKDVVGYVEAEDVLQDATEYVWKCLPVLAYLRIAYLRRAVRSAALMTVRRRSVRGHDREVSWGSTQDLVRAEARHWRAEHGGRSRDEAS
jgi:hypothetical protein